MQVDLRYRGAQDTLRQAGDGAQEKAMREKCAKMRVRSTLLQRQKRSVSKKGRKRRFVRTADVVMKGWVELVQANNSFVCDAASSACNAPVRVLWYLGPL